jgi:crossover junction endodeoxyribonuclease RuvC
MTWFCGVDPGKTGAIAFVSPDGQDVIVHDMPVAGGEVDAVTFFNLVSVTRPQAAIIEQVASRPGQGVRSVFSFGQSYGVAIGVLGAMGVSLRRVAPSTWKKTFGLIGRDKDASRAEAIRLFPKAAPLLARKKDDGRAESILLAEHLRRILR